ncbi:MAG: hypothetical protein AAFW60_12875 [Pseudomonadota bacterium]
MSRPARIYYWLVPCAEDATRYSKVISRLAATQGAPLFTPHASLAAIEGVQPDLAPCLELLAGLEVEPLEIDMTDAFTMSLFVRIERHPALLQARQYMQEQPGAISSRDFDPHLSLCYGVPPQDAENWEAVRALLDQPIRFNRLNTVAIPPRVETYDDVRAWKALETHAF